MKAVLEPIVPGSRIAIYVKPGHPRGPELLEELAAWLTARGYKAQPASCGEGASLAIVLGGDGSILRAAPELAPAATPVLAVHLGTLGFLTDTALEDLYPSLETVLAGRGVRRRLALLETRLERAGREVGRYPVLNEAVVGKSGLARLLTVEVTIAGEPVGDYRADGVLVATPTGSTAYNLSAGGSVVHPQVAALLVTPICPHARVQRPLLVPAEAEVALTLLAGDPAHLTLDGQHGVPLEVGDRLVCRQSRDALVCVSARAASFYERVRTKLG